MWIKKERFRWNKQIVPAKTLPFSFYFLISGSAGVRDKPSRRYMLMEGCRPTPALRALPLHSYVSVASFYKRKRA